MDIACGEKKKNVDSTRSPLQYAVHTVTKEHLNKTESL